jgi:hypothetical protein
LIIKYWLVVARVNNQWKVKKVYLERVRAGAGGGVVDGLALHRVRQPVLGLGREQLLEVLDVGVDGGAVERRHGVVADGLLANRLDPARTQALHRATSRRLAMAYECRGGFPRNGRNLHVLVLVEGLAVVEQSLLVEEVEAIPAPALEPFDEETGQLPVARLRSHDRG